MSGVIAARKLLSGLVESDQVPDLEVGGLSLDSRRLNRGDGFVALAGLQGHGMNHLDQAIARGAAAIFHDGRASVPADCPIPAIEVPDLAERLDGLARRVWGDPGAGMDLVAVTGTNGKSSVAWLLAQALDGAMIGTLGIGRPGTHRKGDMTTPDVLTLYRELAGLREAGLSTVVMEASSHALDQGRLAGLTFSSAIFTTLGHDHLDYHADRQSYGAAKARLFHDFPSDRQLINLDDGFGLELAEQLKASPGLIGYSLAGHPDAHVRADSISSGPAGLKADLIVDGRCLPVRSSLIGRVNLWNLLIVAAELAARGVSDADIIAVIDRLEPVPGRMQPIREGNGNGDGDGRLAVVDYAHTPDALNHALESLRELTPRELWCVFGCGGDRDRAKRPRMGRIAESLADHVVLTDDNPRHEDGMSIIRAIQEGMHRPHRCLVIRDRAEAIARAIGDSRVGDVVLIAGKGHEADQVVGDERRPFDDVASAREALEALPC
jgi:UDP-N-acetylmuramoyl-L-alanyl-D-glutamate--2,6-diaminopimelate ligase